MPSILPPNSQDWTDAERSEISRIGDMCGERAHFKLECSYTDEGDPWCVIYDKRRHRIVAHIARIDRRYVVVFPQKYSEVTATMAAATNLVLKFLAVELEHQYYGG